MRFFALALLAALFSQQALAGYYPRLYTSTRATAMGGAYVALADDESAIFMNPAGLAGAKGFTFNYAAADVEVSWDTILTGLTGATAFTSIDGNALNAFMGKNLFVHTQFSPSLVFPGFGLAFLSDQQFSLIEQNVANPDLALGYQMTNGIQAAFGLSVLPKRLRTRQDFRLGIAAKMMWRRGGHYHLGFIDLLNFTQGPLDAVHGLTGSYGVGYGVDFGTQYIRNVGKNLTLATALVMTDIGDTTFEDPKADQQKANLTWGMAATYKMSKLKATLAVDYDHILQDTDARSRTHIGVELGMPFVTLYSGINQLNLTYGAALDLWIFRITGSSYGVERGVISGINGERRYALRVALKLGF